MTCSRTDGHLMGLEIPLHRSLSLKLVLFAHLTTPFSSTLASVHAGEVWSLVYFFPSVLQHTGCLIIFSCCLHRFIPYLYAVTVCSQLHGLLQWHNGLWALTCPLSLGSPRKNITKTGLERVWFWNATAASKTQSFSPVLCAKETLWKQQKEQVILY